MTLEPNIVVAIFGASATILAIVVKTIGQKLFRIEGSGRRPRDVAKADLWAADERLDEAREALLQQQATVKTNRLMSGLLTIGQYIVGGLLASSFIQQSLPREIVGALGVLVLLSSLLYQHFRPDLRFRGARARSHRLEALIRDAEDDLYAMENDSKSAPTIVEFRRRISKALSDIRASELQDMSTKTTSKSHGKTAT